MNSPSYAFFGTGPLAESTLATLVRAGLTPKFVVTKEDKEQGRHMIMTPPYIKTWCKLKDIPVLQPTRLDEAFVSELKSVALDLIIVASYGKIIPESILSLPSHGVLNVHPSLLPLYRGPSPIESALLDGVQETGVTIIKLDNEIDHGPILAQSHEPLDERDTAGTLEIKLGQRGGELLAQVVHHYMNGHLLPKEQDHTKATPCKKITKEDGEIKLSDPLDLVLRKYRAFTPWPGIFFFTEKSGRRIRVKINEVSLLSTDTLLEHRIKQVTPEGKASMSFEDFKRGYVQ